MLRPPGRDPHVARQLFLGVVADHDAVLLRQLVLDALRAASNNAAQDKVGLAGAGPQKGDVCKQVEEPIPL